MVVVIAIYKCIKATHCTPMYTTFYDNYNSTENEKRSLWVLCKQLLFSELLLNNVNMAVTETDYINRFSTVI